MLHYLVRCLNTANTPDAYGEPTEEGYYKKLSQAFKTAVVSKAEKENRIAGNVAIACSQVGPFIACVTHTHTHYRLVNLPSLPCTSIAVTV